METNTLRTGGHLLPEDLKPMSTFNKTAVNQCQASYQRSSNATSKMLLNDVWCSHIENFEEYGASNIMDTVDSLLQNVNLNQTKTWKSTIDKCDPVSIFEETVSCKKCDSGNFDPLSLEQFIGNTCKCDLGLNIPFSNVSKQVSSSLFVKNLNQQNSSNSCLETSENVYKPRFGRPRQSTNSKMDVTNIVRPEEVNLEQEEEDNKTHKSNVAKIMFKTAKETLLASNPAARRTLGASRKAQSKFVSPMLGAQEKQETSEFSITDERLKHLDPKMIELIESEIIDKGNPINWDDIAGLQMAKSVIQEAVVWPLLRPDIFTGLRRPPKGILLFGPPGTGKTLIGKCVAAQCNATFFSISASSLTSKWIGDGEKMVRALFAVARCHQPAVIFIDEIDSLLTQRSDGEHEATRRIKTEFLVQFDGAATEDEDRLLIVGATNRPQELDEAARRRLVKRLYIPLPDAEARQQIIANLLDRERNNLTPQDVAEVASRTDGYSGADMKSLCSEAAMGPIRAVPFSQIASIASNEVRPVCLQDFLNALQRVRPSVSQDDLGQYVKWNTTYGQGF